MNIGEFVTVKVDPSTNEGFEDAPALVTGVHEDGSLRLRVFGPTSVQDTVRNYVGDDGEPYQHPDAEAAPAAGAQPRIDTSSDVIAPTADVKPQQQGVVDEQSGVFVQEGVDQLSDQQAADLQAALDARSSRQQPPTA